MALSITTTLIFEAAKKRPGWQVVLLDESRDLMQVKTPTDTFYIRNNSGHKSNKVAGYISTHKDLLYDIVAKETKVQLPASMRITDTNQALDFLNEHKRVVVKPTDQSHGNGVTVDVTTEAGLQAAITLAKSFSPTLLIQQQVIGDDYRLVYVGGRLAAAAIREPASVLADGEHTIRQLIEIENQHPDRGEGYQKKKTRIDMTVATQYLGDKLDSVPLKDEKVRVVGIASIGKGGLSIDVTDTVSSKIKDQAQELIDHFKIGLAGIDFMVTEDGEAYFIEINTAPSFGLHEYPSVGVPRGLPDTYLDWLTRPGL